MTFLINLILLVWKEENNMLILNIEEWLKIDALKRAKDPRFLGSNYIGFVICKNDVFDVKKGDAGLLTCYSPERKSFVIDYGDGSINFGFKEEWFLNNFHVLFA